MALHGKPVHRKSKPSWKRPAGWLVAFLVVLAGCIGPVSTTRIELEQRRVVDVDTHQQSMQTAFQRVYQLGIETYNFPDEAIIVADSASGTLVFKEFAVIKREIGDLASIGYTLRMDIRDRLIRYTFVIGDPNDIDLTTPNDGVAMKEFFGYLKQRIAMAIERDTSFGGG